MKRLLPFALLAVFACAPDAESPVVPSFGVEARSTPIDSTHFKRRSLRLVILRLSKFFGPRATQGSIELDAIGNQLASR